MKTVKARGVVLKEFETGEADKRLLLLCKDCGRVMVYARGARKPKSKFLAAAQIFTYSDFILAEGRGFYSLAQAEVIEPFYALRTDFDKLETAYRLTNICDKTIQENTECNELLLTLLKSLSYLAKDTYPPPQIMAVFLLRFFAFYGLRPNVTECAVCGEAIPSDSPVCWGMEGIICKAHIMQYPTRTIPLSHAALAAMRHILNAELPQCFNFEATENLLQEINQAADLLWQHHFEEEKIA